MATVVEKVAKKKLFFFSFFSFLFLFLRIPLRGRYLCGTVSTMRFKFNETREWWQKGANSAEKRKRRIVLPYKDFCFALFLLQSFSVHTWNVSLISTTSVEGEKVEEAMV